MDQGSRRLLTFLIVLIVASVLVTYWNTMHKEDFVIINDLDEEEESSDAEVESTI